MHNSKLINDFIEKVNKEAEEAAQKVFDKYDKEFVKLVSNQLKPGETLCLANGSRYFKKTDPLYETDAQDKFGDAVAQIQYLKQRAGFNTYEFKK